MHDAVVVCNTSIQMFSCSLQAASFNFDMCGIVGVLTL